MTPKKQVRRTNVAKASKRVKLKVFQDPRAENRRGQAEQAEATRGDGGFWLSTGR